MLVLLLLLYDEDGKDDDDDDDFAGAIMSYNSYFACLALATEMEINRKVK